MAETNEYKQIAEGLLMLDWILGYELTQEKLEFLDSLRNRAFALLEADAQRSMCIHNVSLLGTCALCESLNFGQPVRLVVDLTGRNEQCVAEDLKTQGIVQGE